MFYACLDVDVEKPDEKSVMTYVAQFLKYYPDPHHTVTDVPENDVSLSCITMTQFIMKRSFINIFYNFLIVYYISF